MCFIIRSVILFCLTAAQIAVMITNGGSDDQVDAAAAAVADGGISLFAVGECGSGDAAVSLLLLPTYQVEFFFFFCLGSDSLSAPFAVRYSSPEHLNSQCCCKIVVFSCTNGQWLNILPLGGVRIAISDAGFVKREPFYPPHE